MDHIVRLGSASTLLTLAEGTLGGDSLTHLVEDRGDLDWRAGLTESALARIDVAGMVTADLRPEQDLDGVRQATKRGVRIRRVFLIDTQGPGADYEPYRRIGVEVRALHSDDFSFLLDGTLTEFAIFDGQLSYEVRQPAGLDAAPPTVTLVADQEQLARRQSRFEEIWEAAERV